MHVTVTTTRGDPRQPAADATLAGEAMYPWLEQIDGFRGMLMLSDGAGETLAVTFWESREASERHRLARDEFRDRIVSTVGVTVESAADYELTFAAFRAPLPDVP